MKHIVVQNSWKRLDSNLQTDNDRPGKVLVVITYLTKEAQGRELEFAIAGWRRHFKEDYLIVLTGENLPRFDGDDIAYVESPRVPDSPGNYRSHLDYVSCLRKVRQSFPDREGFILVADDCYAVRDFDLADVKALKYLNDTIDYDPQSPNAWRRDKMRTKHVLQANGYPQRDFTTHLPIWYEWEKLERLWDDFGMDKTSFVVEDLYHNIYYPVAGAAKLDEDSDRYKCGVYTTRPDPLRLRHALDNKIWITNSPMGYVPSLVELLEKYYGV